MKFLKPIILLIALFGLIDSQLLPVPQQDIQLAGGLLQGSDFYASLGLLDCKEEINSVLTGIESLTETKDKIELFSELSKLFEIVPTIYEKCPQFESKLNEAIALANKVYHLPGNFLSKGISEMISFSGIKKLWDLVGNLKKEDLTKAGVTLGEILKKFINSDFTKKNKGLNFLADIQLGGDNDACLDILNQLLADVKDIGSNVFKDISKVKVALDDFFVQLKRIPSVCI